MGRIVTAYVAHYNETRLHSATGYVTPKDRLLGNDVRIHRERDRKLTEACERFASCFCNTATSVAAYAYFS